jgi:hypothetical protein
VVALCGCGKAETNITVHNMGPEKLTNVKIIVGSDTHTVGELAVDQTKHITMPPIMGKRVAVDFDGISIPNEERIAVEGQLPEDRYGEITIAIKDGSLKQVLAGHPQ